MNLNVKRKVRVGFSLTELLVTMFIITVLAAITVGVVVQSGDRVKYQQAETFIGMLENSLESYYFDNGAYPQVVGSAGGTIVDAQDLFQNLGGYTAGGLISNPPQPSYADYLDPNGKNVSHPGTSWQGAAAVANFAIIDPFKNYIRYRAASSAVAVTNNPTYDLWSIGADQVDNAGAGDDVSNW